MKMKRKFKILLILFLVGLNISCDQITKIEVRERIDPHQIIQVVKSNVILTNVENTGAALSLGSNLPPFAKLILLQLLPVLVLALLLGYILIKKTIPPIQLLAFTCIVGGGLGNIVDRIRYNSVTDFMYLEIGPLHTGIFNMADVSVTLGALLILIEALYHRTRKKHISGDIA